MVNRSKFTNYKPPISVSVEEGQPRRWAWNTISKRLFQTAISNSSSQTNNLLRNRTVSSLGYENNHQFDLEDDELSEGVRESSSKENSDHEDEPQPSKKGKT